MMLVVSAKDGVPTTIIVSITKGIVWLKEPKLEMFSETKNTPWGWVRGSAHGASTYITIEVAQLINVLLVWLMLKNTFKLEQQKI